MNSVLSKIVACGLGLALILISGIATSKVGKPYHPAIFGVHKIATVGTIILLVVIIRSLVGTGEPSALAPVAWGITGLLFLALIVTGSLLALSMGPGVVLRVHQVLPLLAVGFSVFSVYLLLGSELLTRTGAAK